MRTATTRSTTAAATGAAAARIPPTVAGMPSRAADKVRKEDVPSAPLSAPKFKLQEKKQPSSNVDAPDAQLASAPKSGERVPESKEDGALAADRSATPSAFDAVKSVATSALDMARSAATTVVDAVKSVTGAEPPNDREKAPYGKSMNRRDEQQMTRDVKAANKAENATATAAQWEGEAESKRNTAAANDSWSFDQSEAGKMPRNANANAKPTDVGQWSASQQRDSMDVRRTGNDSHQHAQSYDAKPIAGRTSDGVEQGKSWQQQSNNNNDNNNNNRENSAWTSQKHTDNANATPGQYAQSTQYNATKAHQSARHESTLERDLATAATKGESAQKLASLSDSDITGSTRRQATTPPTSNSSDAWSKNRANGDQTLKFDGVQASAKSTLDDAKEWTTEKKDKLKESVKESVVSGADAVKESVNKKSDVGKKLDHAADVVKDKVKKL